MIKSIYTFFLLLSSIFLFGQSNYWQQHVEYKINAELDTSEYLLDASCEIQYFNHSPDTLDRIYIHLWANAFSSKSSPFANQALQLGMTDFYFANENQLGGYQDIQTKLSNSEKTISLQYANAQNEIAYIDIPKGLAPEEDITITFLYKLKIPKYFARLGKSEDIYNMVAWYPKPAVYDQNGWHTFPYLSMGEFYSEFANYDVTLSTPSNFIIAHSGTETKRYTEGGLQHIETRMVNAHDYAWFASPNYIIEEEKVVLKNDQIINLKIYRKEGDTIWKNALEYSKQALTFMADYMGDYPYANLSIVQGNDSGLGGAMEYPSIKVIKNVEDTKALEYYIAHEIGHSWFYAAIGTNERDESYFDEGLTTFLEQKYTAHYYNGANFQNSKIPSFFIDDNKPVLRHFTEGQICRHMHQPLTTPVTELSAINYGLNAYQIGSTLICHLESLIGEERVKDILRGFYKEWKFKHPSYNDLISYIQNESQLDLSGYDHILAGRSVDASISDVTGENIFITNHGTSELLTPLLITYEDGSIERENIKPSQKIIKLTKSKKIKSAILDPDYTSLDINPENNVYPRPGIGIKFIPSFDRADKKDIYINPLLGYNSYDGAMIGISMFNSTFPAKNLKWNITPLYGIRSNNIIGQSWISYDTRPSSEKIRKIQYRLGVKSFTIDNNESTSRNLRYVRVDPSITIHHYHNPASKKYSKTSLRQLWTAREYTFLEKAYTQNITRLTHNRYNFDKLQPNELEIELEYNRYRPGNEFEPQNYLKLSLDYRQGFLFAKNKKFDVRFFASTFLLNTQRESSSYNNLLAQGSIALLSQGFTDYSYDEYFLDRQGTSKNAYRQIANTNGGFKDALGSAYSRIGQSNDFAMAINLKSNLPIVTSRLPLKLFFDTGYARTKSFTAESLEGELFYSGGIMLEFVDGLFNVYLPIIASKNISDTYTIENRNILSRITFSMDLHRFNPWDLADDYNF